MTRISPRPSDGILPQFGFSPLRVFALNLAPITVLAKLAAAYLFPWSLGAAQPNGGLRSE